MFLADSFTMCQTAFSDMPSPHILPTLLNLLLFVIHPTSNGNEQQAERIKGAWHLGSLPPSSARSP
jgi:hypothetical protein